MNIIKRIWNRVTADTSAPAGGQALQTQRNNEPILRGPSACETGDDFQRKFAAPPYFIAAIIRQPGLLYFHPKPVLTTYIWKLVFERAGGNNAILSKSERQQLAELKAQFDEVNAKLAEVTFFSSGRIRREFESKGADAMLKGEPMPFVPNNTAVVGSITTVRRGLHEQQKKISPEIFELVSKVVKKMREAARSLAIELDAQERKKHESFMGSERPFIPSAQLCAVAFIGLAGADSALRNYKLTGLIAPPDADNLLTLFVPETVTPKPLPVRREVARRDFDAEARAKEAEARKQGVAKRNELVDRIRQQAEVAKMSAADAKAMREAEADLRRAQAVEKLQAAQSQNQK